MVIGGTNDLAHRAFAGRDESVGEGDVPPLEKRRFTKVRSRTHFATASGTSSRWCALFPEPLGERRVDHRVVRP